MTCVSWVCMIPAFCSGGNPETGLQAGRGKTGGAYATGFRRRSSDRPHRTALMRATGVLAALTACRGCRPRQVRAERPVHHAGGLSS